MFSEFFILKQSSYRQCMYRKAMPYKLTAQDVTGTDKNVARYSVLLKTDGPIVHRAYLKIFPNHYI